MANHANEKALIVGNADIPLPAGIDLSKYNYVVIFNHCSKPELFPFVTHHFLRLGHGNEFSGHPEWRQHKGRVCVCNTTNDKGRQLVSMAKAEGRSVREIDVAECKPKQMPGTNGASTGIVAIEYFRRFEIKVDLCCFTWEGLPSHNWAWEKSYCEMMQAEHKLRILGETVVDDVPILIRLGNVEPSVQLPESYTILTCTGGRPQCLAMLRKNLERQFAGKTGFQWLVIDDGIESSEHVLKDCPLPVVYVRRERGKNEPPHTLPLNLCAADLHVKGAVLIAEDDDYYLPGWFDLAISELSKGFDLFGEAEALYYHVPFGGVFPHTNRQHASLAATCMSEKAWKSLVKISRAATDPCVDMALWKQTDLSKSMRLPNGDNMLLQTKAMPGRAGTLSSHKDTSRYRPDDGLHILRKFILPEDLPFYLDLVRGERAENKRLKLGVMFPCSSRESLPFDIVDIATYYRAIGFDRIVICNNGGMECLRELIPFAEIIDDLRHPAQNEIMLRFAEMMTDCDWVLFCDSDEYLFEKNGDLRAILAGLRREVACLTISWLCYSFGKESRNNTPSPLLSVNRMPEEAKINRHVKCICRPQFVTGWPVGPHIPQIAEGYTACNTDGARVETAGKKEYRSHLLNNTTDKLYLAHFYYRSKEDARRKERHNNLFNGKPKQHLEIEYVLNESTIYDDSFRNHYKQKMGIQ